MILFVSSAYSGIIHIYISQNTRSFYKIQYIVVTTEKLVLQLSNDKHMVRFGSFESNVKKR